MKEKNKNNFAQQNSSYEEFLQSKEWMNFQESTGKIIHNISQENFRVNIIEHRLSVVGKYFYIPRGFAMKAETKSVESSILEILNLAKEKKAGWIRIDLNREDDLEKIKNSTKNKIEKAPHDMQPKQLFVIDISKSEDEILADMKPKTRYNIRLAKRKGVTVKVDNEKIDEFLKLVQTTSERNNIKSHPKDYYRKMMAIPDVDLYVAEYEGKIIASSLVIFYKGVATYLHGGSDNEYRNVMAPFLIQWQAILDAKEKSCVEYDFGGVKTEGEDNTWQGITRFKLGFAKGTYPVDFLGSYDIVVNPMKYRIYRTLQKIKTLF